MNRHGHGLRIASLLIVVALIGITSPALATVYCTSPTPPAPAPPEEAPSPHCAPPCTCQRSPCYVSSGIYVTDATDLSVRTVGPPLAVYRKYVSHRAVDGPLGVGWTTSLTSRVYYGARLLSPPSTYQYNAEVILPDGTSLKFTANGSGFMPPSGRGDVLVRNGDGSWKLTPQRSRAEMRFNVDGTLSKWIDEFGNTVDYTYQAGGKIDRVTDVASGRYLQVTWLNGRISEVQDSASRTVRYRYDPTAGTLLGFDDALTSASAAEATTYTYTTGRFGPLLSEIKDQWGRTVSKLEWYAESKLKSYTEGAYDASNPAESPGEKYTYTYNTGGGPTTKTDSFGSVTYVFDSNGLVQENASFNGQGLPTQAVENDAQVTYTYNARGNVLTRNVAQQAAWTYEYDPSFPDQVTKMTPSSNNWPGQRYEYFPPGSPAPGALKKLEQRRSDGTTYDLVAEYTYNSRGQVLTETTGAAGFVSYTYFANGDLQSVQTPAGTTSFTHDALGRMLTVVAPGGSASNATTYTYDALDRPITVTLPKPSLSSSLSFTTTFEYDLFDTATGRSISVITDANGRVTRSYFDVFGHMVETRSYANASSSTVLTSLAYAYRHNLLRTITDANGNKTTYTYDAKRRLISTTFPDGLTESYGRMASGTLTSVTDRRGNTTAYQYDVLGRPTTVTFPGNKVVSYSYDGVKLVSVADGLTTTPFTYQYTYDSSYRLLTETMPGGYTMAYTYSSSGYFSAILSTYTLSPPAGSTEPSQTVAYGYDNAKRISEIQWSHIPGTFTFTYAPGGGYDLVTFPDGMRREHAYDAQGRLTRVANVTSGGVNLATFDYSYDYDWSALAYTALGLRTSMTVTGDPAAVPDIGTFKYYYDPLNQLVRADHPGVYREEATYDAIGNRKTFKEFMGATPLSTADYSYHRYSANPNADSARLKSISGGADHTYDGNGNLLTSPGGQTYGWDVDNRLTQHGGVSYKYDFRDRRIGEGGTSYLYRGADLVGQRNASSLVVDDFLFGPAIDEPLAKRGRTGEIHYYLTDGLGSIMTTVTPSMDVVAAGRYSAWGKPVGGSPHEPFGYTGRESSNGLWYYRARYYDANAGRFISEDPIGYLAGPNLYAYASQNPVSFTDPTGLYTQERNSAINYYRDINSYNRSCGTRTGGACSQVSATLTCQCPCTNGRYTATPTLRITIDVHAFTGARSEIPQAVDPRVTDARSAIAHEYYQHIDPATDAVARPIRALEGRVFENYEQCRQGCASARELVISQFSRTLRETQARENRHR